VRADRTPHTSRYFNDDMSFAPTKDRYAATIRVTDGPFREPRYISAHAPDKDEALRLCEAQAAAQGWRAPTRWQWWRRKDSKAPFVSALL
jgi:hypothetical protein